MSARRPTASLAHRGARRASAWAPFVALMLAALLAAPAHGQYFGKNKITYREFDWQIYHSPHFDVYFYEDERDLLPKIVSFAESAYDELSQRLDYQIQEATPLIVYATHSAFEQNNIIVNFIPEGIGAFASSSRNRMVMPADLPDPQLYELVKHELTHIFQYHILYQGNLGRAVAAGAPIWLTEGMASYFAQDEQSWDKMALRDAVVNDFIPPVSRTNIRGFFAYRYGHAVFDFIEERWGEDGVTDFLYEFRNTIGGQVARPLQRAFRMEPEDFDTEFRRWLRKQYLPALVASGEPSDFGRPFRAHEVRRTWESSGVASPSGDLLAAFSNIEGETDVVLFDTRQRRLVRNLTSGFSNDYQYLIAQYLEAPRSMGSDLAFSPDGDTVAVFAKRENGRSLLLLDVLSGRLRERIDLTQDFGLEQILAPAFSPDGRTLAFSAWRDGDFDVFFLDLQSRELTNFTDDDLFNGSPVFSPDGAYLVFSTVVGGFQKLFRADLANPAVRRQVTVGESHERDATFSPDGNRLYFSSDRSGAENIHSVDLTSGQLLQHTNAVTGCFMPTVFLDEDGREQLVYTGYWQQRFYLYLSDTDVPPIEVEDPQTLVAIGGEAMAPEALPRFEPDIQVTIDPANEENYAGFDLFLENAATIIAVDDDQTVLGQAILTWSDLIGDRRVIASFTSVSSFSDFDAIYLDQSRRLNFAVRLYDDRDFFLTRDQEGRIQRDAFYSETGLIASLIYPFDFYRRVELGGGYMYRDVSFDLFVRNRRTNEQFLAFEQRTDDFPVIQGALVEDTVLFANYGPIAGRRIRLAGQWGPDLGGGGGGTLTTDVTLDARAYIPLTRRSNFAFRAYGALSDGDFSRPYFMGGFDTLRGLRLRSEVGDRVFYANAELRFPLVDVLATPIFSFGQIRGLVFLDVGGAYFKDAQPDWKFYDSDENRLVDGLSSYGFGISTILLGLDVNWDFAKLWDLKDSIDGGFTTSFWIGSRF